MHTARCPRCGYHLRGVMETWRDSCPLDGTCSECGLAFDWARVCCPGKFVPLWCIEYERGPRAWWGTARRLVLPWVFWSRLQITHPPRLARVLRHVLAIAFLAVLLGYIFIQSTTAITVYFHVKRNVTSIPSGVQNQLALTTGLIARIDQIKAGNDPVGAYKSTLGYAGIDDLPDEVIVQMMTVHRQQLVAQLQQLQGWKTYEFAMPLWLALGEALFAPYSQWSFGQAVATPNPMPYPAPRELHSIPSIGSIVESFDVAGIASLMVLLGTIGFPFTMLLLVQTRRRSKLHTKHLVRITLYQLALLLICLVGVVIVLHSFALWQGGRPPDDESVFFLFTLGGLALHFLWWMSALHLYARVPHVFFVVLIHSIMTVLFIATGTFFIIEYLF